MTEREHRLGELLREAREAKGVDLPRVERETKIRARYLEALESGQYRDLPGSVYTKGFLRNYGLYLGLDPEYLIDLYRIESSAAVVERPVAPTPPRPIGSRRAGAFVVTPGAVFAAILTVGVVALVAWLGYEFVNFARMPTLRITEPAGDLAEYLETTYTVRGVTEPGARVTVSGLRENPTVLADADGRFEMEIRLQPGSNQFSIVAEDAATARLTDPQTRTINVVTEATASQTPDQVVLDVSEPQDGRTDTPVRVAGQARPGATVTVEATLVEEEPIGFSVTDAAGTPIALETEPPAAPEPRTLEAGSDGEFSGELSLPPGTWRLAFSADDAGESVARRLRVRPPSGLSGTLRVESAASYIEVDQDSTPLSGVSGSIGAPGTEHELAAEETLRIRAGNAAAVHLTINGVELGAMGASGAVVEWQISVEGG